MKTQPSNPKNSTAAESLMPMLIKCDVICKKAIRMALVPLFIYILMNMLGWPWLPACFEAKPDLPFRDELMLT